jgi:hypothetical protein
MALFWDVAIIVLMMEAISTSETSVNFYQTTWRNIPENSDLHNHRHENLKSHHYYQAYHILYSDAK